MRQEKINTITINDVEYVRTDPVQNNAETLKQEKAIKIKGVKDLMKKIEDITTVIANERDKLRELYDEVDELLITFDCGIDGLDDGIRSIYDAVNSISEVV